VDVRGNLGSLLAYPIVRRQRDPVGIPEGAHGPDDPPRDSEHSVPQVLHRGAWAPGSRDVDAEDMVNTGRVVYATRRLGAGVVWDPYELGRNMGPSYNEGERGSSAARAEQTRALFGSSSPVPGLDLGESEGV
jgi:hypothetical protein